MILSLAVIGLVVHMVIGWTFIWDLVTLVKVHMNLAYYVVVFAISFILWVYITFIHSRFTYGFVNPGEVGWRSPLTGQTESYRPLNFQVIKRSDDIIVHTVLGLKFLGLGTGDIEVKFDVPGGGSQQHTFRNVWRPEAKIHIMERLIQDGIRSKRTRPRRNLKRKTADASAPAVFIAAMQMPQRPRMLTVTRAMPCPVMPITPAAALERSMMRPAM